MERLLVSSVAGLGAVLWAASPALAGPPRIYHTITSSHGYAVLDRTVGCERTEVYVSSSVAMYAGQPGPVVKQGLTAVFVRVSDACAAAPARGAVPAAGGGGGAVLLEVDGQSPAPLRTDNRLRGASVEADIPATDSQGRAVTVHLSVRWTPAGPLEHTTTQSHANLGDGTVSSTANDLRRPVSATVAASVEGRAVDGPAGEAVLEQTRSRCVEVPRPGVEGFYPCFGFPG